MAGAWDSVRLLLLLLLSQLFLHHQLLFLQSLLLPDLLFQQLLVTQLFLAKLLFSLLLLLPLLFSLTLLPLLLFPLLLLLPLQLFSLLLLPVELLPLLLFSYLLVSLLNSVLLVCNKQKQANDTALLNKLSHSYGMSLAVWDHSVTFHPTQVNTPSLTPARQASTRLTYPGGMDGWVDLRGWVHTETVYLSPIQVVTVPSVEQLRWSRSMCYHYTKQAPRFHNVNAPILVVLVLTGSRTDHITILILLLGSPLQKSPRLRHFKSDWDEIWQECSSCEYTLIDRVRFLIRV